MPSLTLVGQMNDIPSSSDIPQTLTLHSLLGSYPEQVAFLICSSPRGPNRAGFRESEEKDLSTKGPWH